MTDNSYMPEYEIDEKDIDSVINWLKINDPENANPEYAIEFIAELRKRVHENAQGESEQDLKQLLEQIKKQ